MAYLHTFLIRPLFAKTAISRTLQFRSNSTFPLKFSEEVQKARSEGRPIVALESTIITHGMPYPQNLKTARDVENIIRKQGATPATIAILKGQLTVGLTEDQLAYLAQAEGVVKASRRDLAPVVANKQDGATTVAGTIIAAQLADIPVFVTGGIGGVHRDGELTMDVSADLTELGRCRTLVVCSGVKSILDIGRTLEYLETQGVCVCAYGETDDFPAFYTRRSGLRAPHRVSDAGHAARVLKAAWDLNLGSGVVVAVPIPEKYAMDESIMEAAIDEALARAKKYNVKGKEVTPFILAAVSEATKGTSLAANIALIKNNSKVGAEIAVEFNKMNVKNFDGRLNKTYRNNSRTFHTSAAKYANEDDKRIFDSKCQEGDILVIGGANVDRTFRVTEQHIQGPRHVLKLRLVGLSMSPKLP